MTLSDFLNRHAGETAWLFGKGPSLSTFDFKKAGPLRCAINDVIAHVPDCVYGFANDSVERWKDVYKKGQILFQTKRCLGHYDSTKPGAVACDVVAYSDTNNDIRLAFSREEIAELPTIRRGTLGSALQILHVMGVRKVVCVGIDGGGKHAQGFEWRTELRDDHAQDYNAIRSAAIDAAHIMGIELLFQGEGNNMNDGKVYVRFLNNSLVQFTHYCIGEIAAFSPQIVRELLDCEAAELFRPENKPELGTMPKEKPAPQIETAAAPMPAKESATVATTKRGRKGK